MPNDDAIEPLTLTIKRTATITGESRSKVYERIGRGEYTALKSDGRTLVTYESIKRRTAGLPRAEIKAPPKRPNPNTA
jgi:hypothetical protein